MAGSVLKRGETWYIGFELPPGPDGRRRRKMLACKSMNKRQAEQRLRDVLSEIHQGTYADPSRLTLGEYLSSWMQKAENRLAATTYESYDKLISRHILPAIGHTRLDRLSAFQIEEFYDCLSRKGRLDGKEGGLSSKTIRNLHGILHAALQSAVRLKLLGHNVADDVLPPKLIKPEVQTVSLEDLDKLLDALDGSKYRLPILIALGTGMRRGEILALRWEDYRPSSGEIAVRRAFAQVRGEVLIKETKTGKNLLVALPAWLVEELDLAREPRKEGWICVDEWGEWITPQGFARGFGRVLDRAGLDLTLHQFRHTQITDLLMEGIPSKAVRERVGHSSATMTERYTHVMPHIQDKAVRVIEDKYGELVRARRRIQNVCKSALKPGI